MGKDLQMKTPLCNKTKNQATELEFHTEEPESYVGCVLRYFLNKTFSFYNFLLCFR